MLKFVNIEREEPFQDRFGIPVICYGSEFSSSEKPLDFNYIASEAVSTFLAYKVDTKGTIESEIDIETSLISFTAGHHICSGSVDFITPLAEGIYYFVVNDKYQSDYFSVVSEIPTTATDVPISISGLEFFDTETDLNYYDRIGYPDIYYGVQYSTNTRALNFRYIASEVITSFVAYKVDALNEVIDTINLDTSLVTNSGGYHYSVNAILDEYLNIGNYYFLINGKYRSANFCIATLTCFSITNIVITDAQAYKVMTINFDAELVGIEDWLDVELTFSFNCGIETYSDTFRLSRFSATSYYINVAVPGDASEICTLSISSDLCEVVYQEVFTVTGVESCCIGLENGTDIELEDGTCLMFEVCANPCFELLDGDIFELFDGDCLELLNE